MFAESEDIRIQTNEHYLKAFWWIRLVLSVLMAGFMTLLYVVVTPIVEQFADDRSRFPMFCVAVTLCVVCVAITYERLVIMYVRRYLRSRCRYCGHYLRGLQEPRCTECGNRV